MLTAGSIFKLVIPAIQKAGTLAFQKLTRLQAINDAIDGVENDSLSKKVIDDFEIVKGSWKGEFTETVDRFLRAFEASGINGAMLNDALVQTRSPTSREAFIGLFVAETEQSIENGDALYNQVAASFEVSVSYLTRDPIMARIVRTSHTTIVEGISRVAASMEAIKLGIEQRPTAVELSEIIPRVVRSVAGDTRHIRVETSDGPKEIEITKLYIAPRLRIRNPDDIRTSVQGVIDEMTSTALKPGDRFSTASAIANQVELAVNNVTLSDIGSLPKVVVLGNPGGGKSTLLQSVCQRMANESLKLLADGSSVTAIKVPVRIVLRDYEHARSLVPQLTIIEYLTNDLLGAVYIDKPVLTRALETIFASGQAYLAFDGLDEILKTANRRQFVDIVNRFVRQYPLCQVLVTSREVGYDKAPLAVDEYEELVLGDFIDEDVLQYAERFIRHLGKKKIAEARQMAAHFMTQTAQNASDLRRNPLMLGLMMWIFNIRDDVPSNRPQIYQECARLMFERWDGDRNIIVELPQTFDRLQVFSYLASKVFEDEDRSAGVTATWIERELKIHLSEVLESVPQAQAAATSLMKFIVDRAWVMSEKGDGVFAFTHQTFLEYFFAKFKDDEHDSVVELFDSLLPHILLDEWDVVSRLAVQIKTDRNRRRQDEAIIAMVDALSDDAIGDEGRRALAGFAARCLEFLIGSESKVRALIDKMLEAVLVSYKCNDLDVLDVVPLLFSGAKERRPFVAGAVEAWIVGTFVKGTDEDRDFVLAFVDGITGKFGLMGSRQIFCQSVPSEVQRLYRGKIIPTLLDEVGHNPKSAKTLFEWTGTLPKAALDKFGFDFIHYARPLSKIAVDGLSGLALAASGKYPDFFNNGTLSRQKAETGLRALGAYFRRGAMPLPTPFARADGLNNPPSNVWAGLLKSMKADVDLRLGACLASFLELNNVGSGPSDSEYSVEYYNELRRQGRLMASGGQQEASRAVLQLADRYRVLTRGLLDEEPVMAA